MKDHHFFAKVTLALVCAGWMLSSCVKDPEFSFSSRNIIFDAYTTDTDRQNIDLSINTTWTATVRPAADWLTITPVYGKGNQRISLAANENLKYSERITFIVFSGEGVKTDSIRIEQTAAIDVAEHIEDEAFRAFCLERYDLNGDGTLSLKECKNVSIMDVSDVKNISSLAGIEYFTDLTNLNCRDNKIESINLGKNINLTKLDCSFNRLVEIDVSNLINLTELIINGSGQEGSRLLQTIDVSKNTKLSKLSVTNNRLTGINLSNNTELMDLICFGNKLTELDLKTNIKLMHLYCSDNQLKRLDLSANVNLLRLYCDNNPFEGGTLNVSHNKALQHLSCKRNGLSSLNLSNNPELLLLLCESNELTTLNVSNSLLLNHLRCSGNRLTGRIDVRVNKLLNYLYLDNNPQLTEIWVWQGFDENHEYYKKDASAQYIY